ncbi:MAG TPA: hypothetical protein VNP04_29550 [Alphaproteobacteria bacterium]|nr:hypothetical protein [Alphaproteobacteria bacterium]
MIIYDWHAQHRVGDRQAIDDVTNGRNQCQGAAADTRVRLLAQAAAIGQIPSNRPGRQIDAKAYAQVGEGRDTSGLKQLVHVRLGDQPSEYDRLLAQRLRDMDTLDLRSPDVHVARLPVGSWFLTVTFTLAKPYVSKDDEAFYI